MRERKKERKRERENVEHKVKKKCTNTKGEAKIENGFQRIVRETTQKIVKN